MAATPPQVEKRLVGCKRKEEERRGREAWNSEDTNVGAHK